MSRTRTPARSLRGTMTPRGLAKGDRVRQLAIAPRAPTWPYGIGAAPSEESWRQCLLAGACPICGRGPFQVVATHTFKVHCVDARELRERAGLYYTTSITAPEYHTKKSELARAQWKPERMTGPKTKLRRLSPAAQQRNRDLARAQTPEQRARGGAKQTARRLAANAERDAEWVRRWNEGCMIGVIVAESNVTPGTVRRALRRAGVLAEGAAASRYHADQKGRDSPNLQAARAATLVKQANDRAALLAAFEAGSSVHDLAAQRGVTVSHLRTRLREAGAVVPDGRRRS